MHAVEANKLDTVLVLREFDGVDWNSKDLLGFSAIMIAVKYLYLDILEILLAVPDIDVNCYNKDGKDLAEIAIEIAIDRQSVFVNANGKQIVNDNLTVKCIEMLSKDTRVNWNNKNVNGETPVVSVVRENNVELAKILLQVPSVDLEITSKDGSSLEQIARYVQSQRNSFNINH